MGLFRLYITTEAAAAEAAAEVAAAAEAAATSSKGFHIYRPQNQKIHIECEYIRQQRPKNKTKKPTKAAYIVNT